MERYGIAGELASVYDQIIPSFQTGIHTQFMQYIQYGLRKTGKDFGRVCPGRVTVHKRIIDISQVMKNRTSSAKPADYGNIVFPDIFTVDLRGGMLVASYNDRGSISP